jgi:tRNA-Thr(GGU) m(6)t(6)A37 methyltransferase TsaA
MTDVNGLIFKPIGVVHSPFKETEGAPIQPSAGQGVKGTVELNPELAPGLKDLEGFSHIILIYQFHLSKGYELEVVPFLDDTPRGVFATRAPRRPNPIGLSIVRLTSVSGNILSIEDVDIVDGTPLLDVKPFVPAFDHRQTECVGWVAGKESVVPCTTADNRFSCP